MTQDRSTPLERAGLLERLEASLAGTWMTLVPGGLPRRPLRVGFSASAHGEGTTTVALCAARSLARQSREGVVLLEANGASPGLAQMAGIGPGTRLADLLNGSASLESACADPRVPGLTLVPWGAGGAGQSAPLGHAELDAIEGLLETCVARGLHVLVDLAPILVHPAGLRLLRGVDTTIAVLSAGRTLKRDAARFARALDAAGLPLAGTILNHHVEELPRWLRGRLGPQRAT